MPYPNSLLQRANSAFTAEDFAQAASLYAQAIAADPPLAVSLRFNLELACHKAGLSVEHVTTQAHVQTTISVAGSAPVVETVPVQETPKPPPPMHALINVDSVSTTEPSHAAAGVTLDALYHEVEAALTHLPPLNPDHAPLVSVLMTAHNLEDYIEAAVTSVLRQSWPNLELIVVDDASSDLTWSILRRLQRSMGRLRCLRLNTNLGTYYAKNYALQQSQGAYIFFQDGDDLCHPERIRLGMHALQTANVIAVRGAYSRVSFPEGQVLPVNGTLYKLGLITLGVRRTIFDTIGYFNCTRKASDEEWFERLRRYANASGHQIRDIALPTYYNTLRPGSLFADMIANQPATDGHIEQQLSPERTAYVEAFQRKHLELGLPGFVRYFTFPVLRDLIPVSAGMSLLPNPKLPVIISLCSVPERRELLRRSLASLAPQADAIHLYLDRYPDTPEFVRTCHPRLHITHSHQVPGLRDNGKFLPLSGTHSIEPCYFFTADDDIIYPPDYVATLVRTIESYGRQAVVGVHGVLQPEQADRYYSGYRKVLPFHQDLERDALVNHLGTGTIAFCSTRLAGLNLSHFPQPGMADLYFSIFCKQHGIPLIAVRRHKHWLQEQPSPNTSLYQEFSHADTHQSALIRQHRPWGYAAIRHAIQATITRLSTQEHVTQQEHATTQDLITESEVPVQQHPLSAEITATVQQRLNALLPPLSACLK